MQNVMFEYSCVTAACENNQTLNGKNPPTHFVYNPNKS